MSPKIAQVVVGLPAEGPFDYSISKEFQNNIAVGQRVKVIFNQQRCLGIVVGLKQKSPFKKLNPILSVLDASPSLDQNALVLAKSLSQYYGCSWGEAIETYLPSSLRSFQRLEFLEKKREVPPAISHPVKNILVHDVTGEKRWPFLYQEIQGVLDRGQGVIFLVPEISFIKEIVSKLEANIQCPCGIAALDKKLKTKDELKQWQNIKEGEIRLVVGTRSAVFAPVCSLGLIVIYEEEHLSYHQEQTPHYHVHRVCQWRSELENCSLLWVSVVPSAELWQEAKRKKWERINFLPDHFAAMHNIDMSHYGPKYSRISFPLQNFIHKALGQGEKVILYFNRRGFATFTRCEHCGLIIKCERCDVPLIYFYSKKIMVCRYCQSKKILPKICPGCQKSYLRSTGAGTEKLESELARFYPQAKIFCYDQENQIIPPDCQIIIATQAILSHRNFPPEADPPLVDKSKIPIPPHRFASQSEAVGGDQIGLPVPEGNLSAGQAGTNSDVTPVPALRSKATGPEGDSARAERVPIWKEETLKACVVGVLDFDAQLNHPDFRSAQKAFALLVRLRQFAREKFLVQTRLADHYCLKAVSKMDFEYFYREELRLRKELGLAPFKSLLLLKIRGFQEEAVVEQAQTLFKELEAHRGDSTEVSEPYPEGIIKLRGQYRYNIMLKGSSSSKLLVLVKRILKNFRRKKGTMVTIYVDP